MFVHLAHGAYPLIQNDDLQRLAAMYSTGNLGSQAKIFAAIQKQYPAGTAFVVLAMNLHHVELGRVDEPLQRQHGDLLKLAAQSRGCVIPFYAADLREPMTEKEVSISLRSHLGEALYFQIAHHNPRRYLGLPAS